MTARRLWSKVPDITLYFWIIKILTTAMGEATSDYSALVLNRYLAVMLGALAFTISLVIQLRTRRYVAWTYWLLVVMVAVFGTMVADSVHIALHVPYYLSTPTFAVILTVVLVAWFRSEHTLSIHSIYTPRRELFYWATVLSTFTLGTAFGDMTATSLHLGYLVSAFLFGALFALPLVCRRLFGWEEVFTFWFAYIMTRPFGASIADYLGMSPRIGGLGIDKGFVSLVGTVIIAAFVAHLSRTRLDVPGEPPAAADQAATSRRED